MLLSHVAHYAGGCAVFRIHNRLYVENVRTEQLMLRCTARRLRVVLFFRNALGRAIFRHLEPMVKALKRNDSRQLRTALHEARGFSSGQKQRKRDRGWGRIKLSTAVKIRDYFDSYFCNHRKPQL